MYANAIYFPSEFDVKKANQFGLKLKGESKSLGSDRDTESNFSNWKRCNVRYMDWKVEKQDDLFQENSENQGSVFVQ